MKKFSVIVFALFAVISLTLSGCGGESKTGDKKGGKSDTSLKLKNFNDSKKDLTFMMWGTPEEKVAVFKVLQKFQKSNPEIGIKVVHVDSMNYSDKLQAMFAGGTPPDVFYLHKQDFYNYSSKGLLMPLDDYEDDEELNLKDFYPQMVDAFKFSGTLFGIPKDWTPFVLYYNQDLFEKNNIPLPDDKWTWDDFLKAAKTLTKDTNKDGIIDQYGFVTETWADWYYSWLKQNDGETFDKDGNWVFGQGKNLDANSEAIQFIADLGSKGKYKVAPDIATSRQLGKEDMFMNGGAAMCMYGRWVMLKFKSITDFKWNYVTLPKKKKKAAIVVTVALSISSTIGKKADKAWKLLKYITSFEGQIFTAESGVGMPSRKSLVASDHYLKAPGVIKNQPHLAREKPEDDPMIKSLKYSVMLPSNPKWMEIRIKMDEQLEDVFMGNKDSKSVILKLDTIVNDILTK